MQQGKEHEFCAAVFHSNQTIITEQQTCKKYALSGFQFSRPYSGSAVGISRHFAYITLLNPYSTGK